MSSVVGLERVPPIIALENVGKRYGHIHALANIDLAVRQGEVTCVLGDNGAGKSTLIKIIAGLHAHDSGTFLVEDKEIHFASPREALDLGIATVYQDLALVPLMPVWRNFFLGSELVSGVRPFRRLDVVRMRRVAQDELGKIGIRVMDIDAPVSQLSGGQMQVVAIARAIHFGARVLVLDEPTASLGVKQSGVVLRYIAAARDAGLTIILITHNPHHAYLVGDHLTVLKLGRVEFDANRADVTLQDLTAHMAGGSDLRTLEQEMRR